MTTKSTKPMVHEFIVECPKCAHQFPLDENLRARITEDETLAIQQAAKEKAERAFEISAKAEREEIKKLRRQVSKAKDDRLALEQEIDEIEAESKRQVQRTIKKELPKLEEIAQKRAEQDAEEKYRLKVASKDKVITDQAKALEEAQRKLAQGSQEKQGEIAEADLEQQLRQAFPQDEIRQVAKGVRGADLVQIVATVGAEHDSILWESKDTQVFSKEWIQKARLDMRAANADCVVIVTSTLPNGVKAFDMIDGVLVTTRTLAVPFARLLRDQLTAIAHAEGVKIDRATKEARLYDLVHSRQFRQLMENLLEYSELAKDGVRKLKDATAQSCERILRNIDQVTDSLIGVDSGIQGVVGPSASALPIGEREIRAGDKKANAA